LDGQNYLVPTVKASNFYTCFFSQIDDQSARSLQGVPTLLENLWSLYLCLLSLNRSCMQRGLISNIVIFLAQMSEYRHVGLSAPVPVQYPRMSPPPTLEQLRARGDLSEKTDVGPVPALEWTCKNRAAHTNNRAVRNTPTNNLLLCLPPLYCKECNALVSIVLVLYVFPQ
jgi:hypothetical protein